MKFSVRKFVLGAALLPVLVPLRPGMAQMAPKVNGTNTYTIEIKGFQFAPRNLTVPVGAKVIWVNRDEEPHKVADVEGKFASSPLDTDEQFTYRFASAGRFEYFCTLHPRMTGWVVVKNK